MANGVKFGRKQKLWDYQRAEAIKRRGDGESMTSIARSYGVAISMIRGCCERSDAATIQGSGQPTCCGLRRSALGKPQLGPLLEVRLFKEQLIYEQSAPRTVRNARKSDGATRRADY
jgi:hypothetical protein